MMERRVSGRINAQAPISSRVLPQPKQKPVFKSIEHTRMQGLSIAATLSVMILFRYRMRSASYRSRRGELQAVINPARKAFPLSSGRGGRPGKVGRERRSAVAEGELGGKRL